MTGDVLTVLRSVLAEALPELYAGSSPLATVELGEEALVLQPVPAGAPPGPRLDDRVERLPLDRAKPSGPYPLAHKPASGARLVRLRADGAVVATLGDDEVTWDADPPQVSLRLRRYRDLAPVSEVEVLYAVTTVLTNLLGRRTAKLQVTVSGNELARVRALTIAVLALEHEEIVRRVRVDYEADGHAVTERLTGMELGEVVTSDAGVRVAMQLGVSLEARRMLRPDEGVPIERVLTPGSRGVGAVSVEPRVEA